MLPSSRRRRTSAAVLLCVALGLSALVSGCAGSSGDASAATATTRPTSSRGPHPTPGHEAYCDSYYHEMAVLLDRYGALGAGGPNDTSRDLGFVEQVQRSYQTLADTAPADTKADLQIVSAYLQTVKSVADATDWRAHADVVAAADRNTEWVKAQCGFDPYNL